MDFSENKFNLSDPALVNVLDELPFWSAPFGIRLLDRIKPSKNLTVLDIGFGTGFPLIELAMRLGNTCKIYGIDPWKAASDRAEQKIRHYGISNIEFLTPVKNAIPVPEHFFDLIVSNNGLNNVENQEEVLSECFRILKPGGKLLFSMNTDRTMIEFYHVLEEVLSGHGLNSSIKVMKSHIYEKRKPVGEVKKLLTRIGFEVASVGTDQFNYSFTDGTTMFNHFFIRMAFAESWKKIVPEKNREMIFKEVEEKINLAAAKNGYFEMTVPFVIIETIKSKSNPETGT